MMKGNIIIPQCNQFFKSSQYVATEIKPSLTCGETWLVVQSAIVPKGNILKGAQALEWIEAIKTAIDTKDANALCKAVYMATV